jgi:hypothetical protein
MLRRISLIAASAAMLAVSALPASAATMQSSTHALSSTRTLSFPGLYGVQAWGNYYKTSTSVRINVCAKDTVRGVFAVGAVTLAYNASYTRHSELGAVAIGYNQTVCRSQTLHYTGHLRVYTFIAGNKGWITKYSKTKTVY